jgi:gamma-glutamyl-gamma-aminobutyrate hydrolase PuuD
LGVQFHPEYVMAKEDSEGKYMDRATTLCIFEALARAAK